MVTSSVVFSYSFCKSLFLNEAIQPIILFDLGFRNGLSQIKTGMEIRTSNRYIHSAFISYHQVKLQEREEGKKSKGIL